ncbi:MAG: hypothetical protein ABSF70_08795 [Terracidiphilus sp.]|jgi:hypothetical protein
MQTFSVVAGSCVLLVAMGLLLLQLRRQRQRDWHILVADLYKLNVVQLSAVATDYLTPRRNQIDMEPQEIWDFLGGYQGLRKMRENADIMLELAAYAQQWNFEEAVIVTERMRLDAITLRRAIRRVELGMVPSRLMLHYRLTLPLYAQEASSAYYLMRQRLLALYESSHAGRYPMLAEVL